MRTTYTLATTPHNSHSLSSSSTVGVSKFVRGWLTALFTTCLASLGHVAAMSAHSDAPVGISPMLFAVVLALTGPICVGLADKKFSSTRTLVSVIFSQLVFHLLFGLAGPNAQSTVTGVYDTAAGVPADNAFAQACHLIGITFTPEGVAQLNAAGVAMAMAHLTAAVITTGLIVHGERVLFALLHRVIRPAIAVLESVIFPVPTHRARLWAEPVLLAPTEVFTRCLSRRGPPRALALAA